jgi:hypothetical protein
MGYGLDGRVSIPGSGEQFLFFLNTVLGHTTSKAMGTVDNFPCAKAAEA